MNTTLVLLSNICIILLGSCSRLALKHTLVLHIVPSVLSRRTSTWVQLSTSTPGQMIIGCIDVSSPTLVVKCNLFHFLLSFEGSISLAKAAQVKWKGIKSLTQIYGHLLLEPGNRDEHQSCSRTHETRGSSFQSGLTCTGSLLRNSAELLSRERQLRAMW